MAVNFRSDNAHRFPRGQRHSLAQGLPLLRSLELVLYVAEVGNDDVNIGSVNLG